MVQILENDFQDLQSSSLSALEAPGTAPEHSAGSRTLVNRKHSLSEGISKTVSYYFRRIELRYALERCPERGIHMTYRISLTVLTMFIEQESSGLSFHFDSILERWFAYLS